VKRREFLKSALVGTAVFGLPSLLRGQTPNNIAILDAGGTNVVAFSAADGLVLVDSGAPGSGDKLLAALKTFAPSAKVNTLFNTHYHLDQTGNNELFGASGAKIIAHARTRQWMSTDYWIPTEDRYEKARPKAARPTQTFETTGSLRAGTEQIDFGYLPLAHTNGDIYIFFKTSNILAVGDVASPVRDPELDYFTGAWIGGRVDAMDRLLALSNDRTRIVPGFGPVMGRAELQAERDVMKTLYDRTVDRVRQGEYVEDMLKGGVMNGLARTWKDPQKFLYDVHKGLWAHHNKLAPNVV